MTISIQVAETGGAEVLSATEVELPEPGAGELRIRVHAVGVNFIDIYFRTGLYPRPLPFGAGLEGAGVVEAVGSSDVEFQQGDRVTWASVPGSYATEVIAPASSVVAIPDPVSEQTAAAVMLQGMTAHYLTNAVRTTRAGDTALVHAAAGGTGLLLVQLLKAAGAYVIGTCSTADKEQLAISAGADRVIRYSETSVPDEVRQITGGRGVDVVYDSVGQATFEGSLASLRPRGLLCSFGQSSGPVPPLDIARLNQAGSLFVTRPSLLHYTADRDEFEMRAREVLHAVASEQLSVLIGARFPLEQASEAHRALEGRRTTGKVLLVPD
jgi:NADPH2:quinone reductase